MCYIPLCEYILIFLDLSLLKHLASFLFFDVTIMWSSFIILWYYFVHGIGIVVLFSSYGEGKLSESSTCFPTDLSCTPWDVSRIPLSSLFSDAVGNHCHAAEKQKIMSYFRKTIKPFHWNIYSKPHSIHTVAVRLYLVSLSEGIFDSATLTPIYISLGEDLDTV